MTSKQKSEARVSGPLSPPSPSTLANALGVTSLTIDWLSGDGSDRCYYRISSPEFRVRFGYLPIQSPTLVLMQLSGSDAEALRKNGYDWIQVAQTLSESGIFVPKVICTLPDDAALVIEDYGDMMLETQVFELAEKDARSEVQALYTQAFQVISRFLSIKKSSSATWCRRSFDGERLAWELRFFMQKYGDRIAGIDLTPTEQTVFDAECMRIAQTLAEDSQFFVHRDFHSRNIMVLKDKIAVIDFQDARLGPASYDIVSLCFDSYVPFSPASRRDFLAEAIDIVRYDHGPEVASRIERLWKPMLLQRQLKAIGSFGYLTVEKKRGDYLKYVDAALRTIEEQSLEDERWPLLSSVIIRRIRSFLDAQRHDMQN